MLDVNNERYIPTLYQKVIERWRIDFDVFSVEIAIEKESEEGKS
jgi:hypothetical protein